MEEAFGIAVGTNQCSCCSSTREHSARRGKVEEDVEPDSHHQAQHEGQGCRHGAGALEGRPNGPWVQADSSEEACKEGGSEKELLAVKLVAKGGELCVPCPPT